MLAGAIVAAMSAGTTASPAAPLRSTPVANECATPIPAEATLWGGTVVTTTQTPQCAAAGFSDLMGPARALYRPHLQASDPKAAVIVYDRSGRHILVTRATTTTTQMQGTAPYCGIHFDVSEGESQPWFGGTYTFNVTPTNVTAVTDEVRITGTVRKFLNIPGCTLTFRAAFMRQRP